MSDLIEREYLLNIARQDGAYGYVSEHEILNAPTAEPLVTVKAKQNEGLYLDTDEETLLETEYIVVATKGMYKEYIHETDGKPRRGKWIAIDSDDICYDHYKCSNCLCEISVDSKRICDVGFTIEDFDYCLQCGAKMEGRKE